MFYVNAPKTPQTSTHRLALSKFSGGLNSSADESALPLNYAVKTYNFTTSGGALKEGMGLKKRITADYSSINGIFLYKRYDAAADKRDDRIIIVLKTGGVFWCYPDFSMLTRLQGVVLHDRPCFVNYRLNGNDVVIMCTSVNYVFVWDGVGAAYSLPTAPFFSSLAIHNERLFATTAVEKCRVWYSKSMDPTDLSAGLNGGGFIDMLDERGEALKAVSYLGQVYIFREYGISKITAYGLEEEFSVSHLFVSSGRIFPDSVCICGDRILFLAEDGVYAFDGVSTYRILKELDGVLRNSPLSHACFRNGRYYLALVTVFDGEEEPDTNNTVIEYNISSRALRIMRGVAPVFLFSMQTEGESCVLTALEEDASVFSLTEDGCVDGVPLEKCWQSPYTDAGYPDRVKRIRELHIHSRYPVKFTIKTENGEFVKEIPGGAKVSRVRLRADGRLFSVKFTSVTPLARISSPVLILDMA